MVTIDLPIYKHHALIVGNGEIFPGITASLPGHPDLILAADGGAENALALGFQPSLVIGDLDSIKPETISTLQSRGVVIRHEPSQAENDLEKCVRYAVRSGFRDLTLIGFTGRRDDQTMATLSVCKKFQRQARFQIFTGRANTFILPAGSYALNCHVGETISLFGFPVVKGISAQGLQFSLQNEKLGPGSYGVSNRATDSKVYITWQSGTLLIYQIFKQA